MNIKSVISSMLLSYKAARITPPFLRGVFLRLWYRRLTGKNLHLRHPKTYNEKIQWLKLHPTPQWSMLADKYAVRQFVADRIGEQYLVRLVGNSGGVWERPEDIDFDSLPERFVLKCNHGSGYNIVVTDKNAEDIPSVKARLSEWLRQDFSFRAGFEMHYSAIPRRIIAEEYMENDGQDLYDYKVWCFEGKARYVMFLSDRYSEDGLRMSFYDREWNMQDISYSHPRHEKPVPKPECLDKILELAEKLAAGLNHVRVDFYILNNGEIRFGEMTMTSCSGICQWEPVSADRMMGDLLLLPTDRG